MNKQKDLMIFNDLADSYLSRAANQHIILNEIELYAMAGFLLDTEIDKHSAIKLYSNKLKIDWNYAFLIFTNMGKLKQFIGDKLSYNVSDN